ncbi:hypothetical protein [Sphingobacterium bovistauri]|uniref:Uncharacterized protein n=1 Tax=Sphingobacterium bovistauri TaxID=2781959 RepID=A0ABS7Z8P3_9SPHI|nr:hypothetical protein [Sphingobacterium bovistauri]MCA5005927.1 hypothetical protein [Sphingobacterium bovistauri]
MKKKYYTPMCHVTIVEIEDSYCNASSTISPSSNDTDIVSEYETGPDDNRSFTWQ